MCFANEWQLISNNNWMAFGLAQNVIRTQCAEISWHAGGEVRAIPKISHSINSLSIIIQRLLVK